MKVLFTTPVLEHPPRGGPWLRVENCIKALSTVSELYIFSRVSPDAMGGAKSLSFYKHYVHSLKFAPFLKANRTMERAKRAVNFVTRRTLKRNLTIYDQETERDYLALLKFADEIKADVIWLGFGNISYPWLKYIKQNSGYKTVLDTDSVWSRFILRGLPFAKDEEQRQRIERAGREKEAEEQRGTRISDITTAVSEVDATYYRKLARNPDQVQIFSNVIDVESYDNPPPPPEIFEKPCIYLAGYFGPRSPTDDAARWVIHEVMPILRRKIPDITFYIAGRGSKETLKDIRDPSVKVVGELQSLLPYLCHANVSVVPLRFESGTRFKILEAAACGIPVVSTTLGAEGIPVNHGKDILIADSPESFSSAIINLIENPDLAAQTTGNLKSLVKEQYSVAALARQGRLILETLQSR